MQFKKQYNLSKDIQDIKIELARIAELKITTESRGWRLVIEVFNNKIAKFLQEVFDKCSNPEKNKIEIITKRMTANALSEILTALDSRVKNEEYLTKQLETKISWHRDETNKQQLKEL